MNNVTQLPPAENQNAPEIVENNRYQLANAMKCLYATTIYRQDAATQRGNAIQAINRMCEMLGFDDLIRHD